MFLCFYIFLPALLLAWCYSLAKLHKTHSTTTMKNQQVKALLLALLSLSAKVAEADECRDVSGWEDSEGDDCDWYDGVVTDDDELMGTSHCEAFGLGYADGNGLTAQLACCVCGGGETFLETCEDVPDFKNCYDEGCGDFSNQLGDDDGYYDDGDTYCSYWDDCADPVTGMKASDACCICGGGTTPVEPYEDDETSAPTKSPTKAPTTPEPTKLPTTKAPSVGKGGKGTKKEKKEKGTKTEKSEKSEKSEKEDKSEKEGKGKGGKRTLREHKA